MEIDKDKNFGRFLIERENSFSVFAARRIEKREESAFLSILSLYFSLSLSLPLSLSHHHQARAHSPSPRDHGCSRRPRLRGAGLNPARRGRGRPQRRRHRLCRQRRRRRLGIARLGALHAGRARRLRVHAKGPRHGRAPGVRLRRASLGGGRRVRNQDPQHDPAQRQAAPRQSVGRRRPRK